LKRDSRPYIIADEIAQIRARPQVNRASSHLPYLIIIHLTLQMNIKLVYSKGGREIKRQRKRKELRKKDRGKEKEVGEKEER
jgi:hypothetical protein